MAVPFRPLFILLLNLLFILTLFLYNGFLNTVFPYSDIPQNHDETSVKWKYFSQHKDNYDIIFLGASTTHFGVIPKLFDKFMAKEGRNVKSFNFGIQGANPSQVDFYLQKILAIKPANLKWIFLDCALDLYIVEFPTSFRNIVKKLKQFKISN